MRGAIESFSLKEELKDAIKIVIERILFKNVKKPRFRKSAGAGLYQSRFKLPNGAGLYQFRFRE